MKITIDVQSNRWWVDGALAQGQRRWEAALLAILLRDVHHSAASACGQAKLQAELVSMGQAQALNRKQVGRLIDGLRDAFGAATMPKRSRVASGTGRAAERWGRGGGRPRVATTGRRLMPLRPGPCC